MNVKGCQYGKGFCENCSASPTPSEVGLQQQRDLRRPWNQNEFTKKNYYRTSRSNKMTSEIKEKILEIYERGDSIEYISKRFDLTKNKVNRFLYIEAKVKKRNREFRMNDYMAILKLRDDGIKIKTIAEMLGLTKDQVHYALYKMNKRV